MLRHLKREKGATTVEIVLWLPILILIIAMIIQFSLIMNARNAAQQASFEGARKGIVSTYPIQAATEAVYGFAGESLPGWREGGRVRAHASTPQGTLPGCPLEVRVDYDVPILFAGFLPGLETAPGIYTVRGHSVMNIEVKP